MDFDISELQRLLANLIRIGKIAQVDIENARVKVSAGGLTTEWLPWTAGRAGSTRKWSAPSVGEQAVLLSPFGDSAQGVVISGIYQDNHPAPASSGADETTVFSDGTTVNYNSESNTLTVTVAGAGNVNVNCKTATVNADTNVTLDTPSTHVTGAMTVDGPLTYKGGLTGSGGSGASLTGNMSIMGDISNSGELTNNSKNVGSGHVHSGVQSGGGNTGAPT